MLSHIISLSLRFRFLVLIVALLAAVYGGWTAQRMPIDVLPDLNRPTVTILAEAHSLVPEDIERLVSFPLERALNGATDVMRVRSASGMGLSMIFVEFDWGTDIYRNRQIVQEKLQLARASLPPGVEPQMAPISSIMGQVQLIGMRSEDGTTDPDELRTLADYDVKYRLLSVPGVAKVVAAGGAPRQLQVIVDAEKLRAFEVSLEDVAEAIEGTNMNVSGGVLNLGHKAPLITVTGLLESKEDLAEAVVRPDPLRPVYIKDVARVEFGPAAIRTGEAGVNGMPGVVLAVFKQPDIDTVALSEAIDRELESIQLGLPSDVVVYPGLFRQSDFIERAVHNVLEAVWLGSLLVLLVLFLFLLELRSTLITLTAIPLSVALTAIIFAAFGLSINTMTLGGIAVAIGALVDDAIVVVENTSRRLRENAGKEDPLVALLVVFRATFEVCRPVLIGTLLVIVAYLPLFYLTGLEGRLFSPIGVAYITSILASLLVSLTVTPVMCFFLHGRRARISERGDSAVVRTLKRGVTRLIRFSLAAPQAILIVLSIAVLGSMYVLANQGTQFLPAFNEGVAQINLFLPPETGLETSDGFGRRLGRALMEIEGVEHVSRRTGRADGDEHVHGVNFSHTVVNFDPEAERSRTQIVGDIRVMLAREFPGVITEVDQPLAHLLSHMLSGVKAQVAIKVFGPDLDVLRSAAERVEEAVRGIPGVVDLYTEPQILVDHVVVEPRRDRLARFGLSVDVLAETVELALEGEQLSLMQLGQLSYPVVIRLEAEDRGDLESIRELYLPTADGQRLQVADVADVRLDKTPNSINRENVVRRIAVQHNVDGRSLGEVVADVEVALAPIREHLAETPGYSIRIGGQFEAQESATRRITIFGALAGILMLVLLLAHFRSLNLALQVLASIPMALIGAVVFIVVTGQAVSIATLVGLIALAGIATRNAILLLDHYVHLMREEGEPFGLPMILRAGQERMVPVVMTALTSGIALVPLVLTSDQPGREILYPVATVIIGGLISSTLLDFLVRPALFWLFGRQAAERLTRLPVLGSRAASQVEDDLQRAALAAMVTTGTTADGGAR